VAQRAFEAVVVEDRGEQEAPEARIVAGGLLGFGADPIPDGIELLDRLGTAAFWLMTPSIVAAS
jgi:hypothetical protein